MNPPPNSSSTDSTRSQTNFKTESHSSIHSSNGPSASFDSQETFHLAASVEKLKDTDGELEQQCL